MKPLILITNDDGVSSRGLHHLVGVAQEYGDIVVMAPDHNASGLSTSITTARPLPCSGSFLTQTLLKEEKMNLPFRAAGECAEEAILQSMWNAGADVALDGKRIPSLREFLKENKL